LLLLLKSPNVLLARPLLGGPEPFDKPLAKVADFGLSARLYGLSFMRVTSTRGDGALNELNEAEAEAASSSNDPAAAAAAKARADAAAAAAGGGGNNNLVNLNPTWAAPEVLQAKPYTTQSDVYSMGIVLWELITHEHPFQSEVKMEYFIRGYVLDGGRPTIPDGVPPDYERLVRSCWHADPAQRPTFIEIVERLIDLACDLAPDLAAALGGGGCLSNADDSPMARSVAVRESLSPPPLSDERASGGAAGAVATPPPPHISVTSVAAAASDDAAALAVALVTGGNARDTMRSSMMAMQLLPGGDGLMDSAGLEVSPRSSVSPCSSPRGGGSAASLLSAPSPVTAVPPDEAKGDMLRRFEIAAVVGEDTVAAAASIECVWQRDEDAPQCGSCSRKFTFTLRRHHCRRCGFIFCGSCLERRPEYTCVRCCVTLDRKRAAEKRLTKHTTRSRLSRSADMRVRDMALAHGRYLWLAFESGRVALAVLDHVAVATASTDRREPLFLHCKPFDRHHASVDAAVFHARANATWTGSADGVVQVWRGQPVDPSTVIETMARKRGWLNVVNARAGAPHPRRMWVVLENGQLAWFKHRRVGSPAGQVHVGDVRSLNASRTGIVIRYVSLGQGGLFELHLEPAASSSKEQSNQHASAAGDGGGAAGSAGADDALSSKSTRGASRVLFDWYIQLQRITVTYKEIHRRRDVASTEAPAPAAPASASASASASSSSGVSLNRTVADGQLVPLVRQAISNSGITALSVIDGRVWSATCDVRMVEWAIDERADQTGLRPDLKTRLVALRQLTLSATPRIEQLPALIGMPASVGHIVVVPVGTELYVVSGRRDKKININASRCVESPHKSTITSAIKTHSDFVADTALLSSPRNASHDGAAVAAERTSRSRSSRSSSSSSSSELVPVANVSIEIELAAISDAQRPLELWTGDGMGTVCTWDPLTFKPLATMSVPHPIIAMVQLGPQVWIATTGGICRFDVSSKVALPSVDLDSASINALLAHSSQFLWAASHASLYFCG
jgi:Protein tyrosine and serine/threonine kinase/FYVE zinc finger